MGRRLCGRVHRRRITPGSVLAMSRVSSCRVTKAFRSVPCRKDVGCSVCSFVIVSPGRTCSTGRCVLITGPNRCGRVRVTMSEVVRGLRPTIMGPVLSGLHSCVIVRVSTLRVLRGVT